MESRDVILRPVITEASMSELDNKRYTFDAQRRRKSKLLLKTSLTLKLLRSTL